MLILTFNDFNLGHTKALMAIYHNPLNTTYIPKDLSKVNQRDIELLFKENELNKIWVIKDQHSQIIGQAGIYLYPDKPRSYEVGYIIDHKYSAKGYGSKICQILLDKIFKELKADYAIARMYEQNLASEKVSLKNGMILLQRDVLEDQRVRLTYIKKNPY